MATAVCKLVNQSSHALTSSVQTDELNPTELLWRGEINHEEQNTYWYQAVCVFLMLLGSN